MGSTSSPCSPSLIPASIPELFPSTRRFENELDQSEMSSYPTTLNSPTSKSLTSIQSECPPVQKDQPKGTKRGNRSEERVGTWKRSEPCNKWNDGTCGQKEEDCRRNHVCNRCEKRGHKGKECRNPSN